MDVLGRAVSAGSTVPSLQPLCAFPDCATPPLFSTYFRLEIKLDVEENEFYSFFLEIGTCFLVPTDFLNE